MKLLEGEIGKRYIVESIEGGCMAKDRLWKLGIIPGVEIEIKRRAPMRGPIMLEVEGVDVVVGRGVADKIKIKEIK